jgi:sulfite exporter TauE/SafE
MSTTLALTALVMGLAGGPHCAAMCGAACAGVVRISVTCGQGAAVPRARRAATLRFHAGRLAGYSAAGAAAATAVQGLAWLTTHTAALRPVWTFFHLAALLWGLMLLARARQPDWVDAAGRSVWLRMRPVTSAPAGQFAAGTLWAFMPCGLLYSALLVASLTGGALQGALSMALFAAGSSVSLVLAPWVYDKLKSRGNALRHDAGTRLAGALLIAAAAWALWADAFHRFAQWCLT